MYTDILIPTWELGLVMITCIFIGYCTGNFVANWKNNFKNKTH